MIITRYSIRDTETKMPMRLKQSSCFGDEPDTMVDTFELVGAYELSEDIFMVSTRDEARKVLTSPSSVRTCSATHPYTHVPEWKLEVCEIELEIKVR